MKKHPLLLISGIFFLFIIIIGIIANNDPEIKLDMDIQALLRAGKWKTAIKTIKKIPKTDESYQYAQEKLKKLIKGNKIFKNR